MYEYITYEYPIPYLFHKELLWIDTNCNIYFAFKMSSTDDWTFYAGNSSHALLSGNILINYGTNETNAQTNYLTTTKDSNGKVIAILPSNLQAKYARLYIATTGVTIHEWRPSTYLTAHEIISGELTITDELSDAPLIRVISSSTDRLKIGNIYDTTYGIIGFDDTSATIFELSDTSQQIAGFDFTATAITSTGVKIKSGANAEILMGNDTTDYTTAKIALTSDGIARFKYIMLDQYTVLRDVTGSSDINGTYVTARTIAARHIVGDTITAYEIAAGTITATQISANTITANEIAANTITAAQIYANTITATQLAASTITANQIKGSEFGTLNITSGKISLNTTDALEIGGSGNIKVLGGGDIDMYEDVSYNISKIHFYAQDNDLIGYIYAQSFAGDDMFIVPGTPNSGQLWLSSGDSTRMWYSVGISAFSYVFIEARYNSSHNLYFMANAVANDSNFVWYIKNSTHNITLTMDVTLLTPDSHKAFSLATNTTAFDVIWADDFMNVADFLHLDSVDDLEAINGIKGSGVLDPRSGIELIDDDTLPWWLCKLDEDKNVIRDPDGKPYIPLKTGISLSWGAIRQVDKLIHNLCIKVGIDYETIKV